MGHRIRYCLILFLSALFLFSGSLPSAAVTDLEETRKLLQKSLTLFELDQEIVRLTEREDQISQAIAQTEDRIRDNEDQVQQTREHAGKVLRAYYMGDRDRLWMILLSADSISDALAIYEYLTMILHNDRTTLNAYADSYQSLLAAKKNLEDEQKELQAVKAAFIAQREQVIAVQKEIDEQLAASSQAEELIQEMERFTEEWKEVGVPLFRRYFSAISGAMQSLPELLGGENGSKYLKPTSFTSATFEISGGDFTDFVRSKDPMFNQVSFSFEGGQFTAAGTENGIAVKITGHYTVENEPVNRMRFHVDELTYNGYVLPATSNRALEEEFDLGFTPSNHLKGSKVTEVTMVDGFLKLNVQL